MRAPHGSEGERERGWGWAGAWGPAGWSGPVGEGRERGEVFLKKKLVQTKFYSNSKFEFLGVTLIAKKV